MYPISVVESTHEEIIPTKLIEMKVSASVFSAEIWDLRLTLANDGDQD